jgi:hypothetical protein
MLPIRWIAELQLGNCDGATCDVCDVCDVRRNSKLMRVIDVFD